MEIIAAVVFNLGRTIAFNVIIPIHALINMIM